MLTAPMLALPITPSLSFNKLQEPTPLIPSDEEDDEEEQEMLLSKEAMIDLTIAITLALQAVDKGGGQALKVSKKIHIAKPCNFDSKYNYVDFKWELHLYIYSSESEFRTDKSKILFTLSYLKSDTAASWVESNMSRAVDKNGHLAFKDSWESFLK
ncbi:hypothetical protein A7U60_g571 [Sanghuangporus baumii]|uniref:Uncharacterized protein n=1 Tax=Sanghuangporus baumii TaxID=108892 RepID=A0A9Q5I5M6_SANBA|nr:hypothetical protein A7U60_g571 [Sanghuangporus baumii]